MVGFSDEISLERYRMKSTEDRLERLERQNRWLKGGLGLSMLAVVAGGLLGIAGQDEIPDVIKAKAFHVVTDEGIVLVKLEDTHGFGLGAAGSVTTFNGKTGKEVAMLGTTNSGDGRIRAFDDNVKELNQLQSPARSDAVVRR